MIAAEVVYLGFNGHVIAINTRDGTEMWDTQLPRSIFIADKDYISLLVDGERIYAHSCGELYCLDAKTGQQLWINSLPGLGYGIANIAVAGNSTQTQAMEHLKSKDSGGGGGA